MLQNVECFSVDQIHDFVLWHLKMTYFHHIGLWNIPYCVQLDFIVIHRTLFCYNAGSHSGAKTIVKLDEKSNIEVRVTHAKRIKRVSSQSNKFDVAIAVSNTTSCPKTEPTTNSWPADSDSPFPGVAIPSFRFHSPQPNHNPSVKPNPNLNLNPNPNPKRNPNPNPNSNPNSKPNPNPNPKPNPNTKPNPTLTLIYSGSSFPWVVIPRGRHSQLLFPKSATYL